MPSPLRDPAFLQAFLDVVIPPSADGRMPGAGSLGLTPGLATTLEADAMLGLVASAGLEAVREAALARDPAGFASLSKEARLDVVTATLEAHPMLMLAVARHLYPAYYQHPRVLEALGEPARPPFPEGFEVEPTDPQLLEKLYARRRS